MVSYRIDLDIIYSSYILVFVFYLCDKLILINKHINNSNIIAFPPTVNNLHEIVFSIKQLNVDKLPDLIKEVSAPLYTRKPYTMQEVKELTSNPIAVETVRQFLTSSGEDVTIDLSSEDHIKATATIRVWNKLLKAEFKEIEVFDLYKTRQGK